MITSYTSSMVGVLTPIWERLLDQPAIGAGENFFDRGGNPAVAIELFSEIAKVTGRELPPTVIFQAPTIMALSALLEQRSGFQSSPLVLLKPGTEPPIFIAHGIGGTVLELFQLARHIDLPNAIYATQAMGIDGRSSPSESIEDMAALYLNEIKKVQPRGPYFLIGHSLGGLVAFEMAQRFSANKDQVAQLIMMDSYPHARYLPMTARGRLLCSQAIRRATGALGSLQRSNSHSSGKPGWTGIYRPPPEASFAPAMRRVRDTAQWALERYRPRFYDGRIKFLRAEVVTTFPSDPGPVWGHLASEFEVETVPGHHLGMLTTQFQSSAAVLTRHLRSGLCLQRSASLAC